MRQCSMLICPQAMLQVEFSDDSLVESGTWGIWEDMRVSITQLVAAGPPAEETALPLDEEADKVMEVAPPTQAQEEVCSLAAASRWELIVVSRSLVICAGGRASPAS